VNYHALRKSLELHEDRRNRLYHCTAGKPTIGVGHNLERPISDAAIDQILSDDINTCIAELDRAFNGWRNHNDARQNVLLEMMFNMGTSTLRDFKRMWAALQAKDYDEAAKQMMHSGWAVQVGKRAATLSNQMKSGEFDA
jgi:lysozyme